MGAGEAVESRESDRRRFADSAREWLREVVGPGMPRRVEEPEVEDERSLSPRKPSLLVAWPCSALLAS